MTRRDQAVWILLAVIVVLAVWFRFYDIQQYPSGLFPDEAANGEDALLVLDGDWRPFYPRGNGREGLFFFLEALAIKAFGIGVWQLHIVSAAIGVLTVVATYFATRVWFGRLSGLLAAGLLATNHWHVTMSRTGFRAILIPLFMALFTAWVGYTITAAKEGAGTQSKKDKQRSLMVSYLYAALAGAAFMGGFYTYIAYRVMVGVVLGVLVLLLLAALHSKIGFPHWKRYWRQLLIAVVAGAVVFLPLLLFFIADPAAFVGRAGQVSVFNRELQVEYGGGTLAGTILFSVRETLLSFFSGAGDVNWRHNVRGFPLLNPLVGVLFLLGVAWAIRGFGMVVRKMFQGKEVHLGMIYAYVLLLLAGMLLPVVTTAEGIPHGLRSIGLVLPIFFLAGTAGSVVLHWLWQRARAASGWMTTLGVVVGLLVLGVLYDGALYFMIARNDAQAAYFYRADLTAVSAWLNDYAVQQPERLQPYLVLDPFSVQTVHFLTAVVPHEYTKGDEAHPDVDQHRWRQLDPATSHLTNLRAGEVMVFTQSTMVDADRYEQEHAETIELVESRRNRFNEEILRIYQGVGAVEGEQFEARGDLDA